MPTATDDSARVQFQPDGEAIDLADIQDAQALELGRNSLLFQSAVRDAYDNPASPSALDLESSRMFQELAVEGFGGVFTPAPGGAFVFAGAGARTLSIAPGMLAMFLEDQFNSPEALAQFRVPSLGLSLTTAVGNATNPRIDIVEISMAYADGDPQTRHFEDAVTRAASSQPNINKKRRVVLTYQIKQGTPAAAPVMPACTLGFVPLAAVWVPANHNAVHAPTNIRDLRWPLGGFRVLDVPASNFVRSGTNPWTVNAAYGRAATINTSTVATASVLALCPFTSKAARLMGFGVYGQSGPNAIVDVGRYSHDVGGFTFSSLGSFDSGQIWDSAVGFKRQGAIQIMAAAGEIAGIGKQAPGTFSGPGLWCNGSPAGLAIPGAANEAAHSRLAVRLACDHSGFADFVRFYVAEGF